MGECLACWGSAWHVGGVPGMLAGKNVTAEVWVTPAGKNVTAEELAKGAVG